MNSVGIMTVNMNTFNIILLEYYAIHFNVKYIECLLKVFMSAINNKMVEHRIESFNLLLFVAF